MSSTFVSIPASPPEPEPAPAAPPFVRRATPRRDRFIAVAYPLRHLLRVRYLHATSEISGGADGPHAGETLVGAAAVQRSDRTLVRRRRPLEALRRRRQRIDTSRRDHYYEAERWSEIPIVSLQGALIPTGVAVERENQVFRQVIDDERAGSQRHRRISTGQRRLARWLPGLDFMIFTWFLTGVLNANFEVVDPTLVQAVAVAAGLALLGTLAVAAWATVVGQHLRRHKDARGDLVWGEVTGLGRAMLYLTAIPTALIAVMMFARVHDEVYQATGDGGLTATTIALALASATALLNVYILYLSFRDGSELTDELDHLRAAIDPHLRARDDHLVQVDRHTARIAAVHAIEANKRHSYEHAATRGPDSALVAVRAARAARPAPPLATDALPAETLVALEQIQPDTTILRLVEADLPGLGLPGSTALPDPATMDPGYGVAIRQAHRWFE